MLLRPWHPSDRAAVVAGYADPGIQRWHCGTMTDDEAGAWIAAWPERWRIETGAGWAVLDADTVVGQISLRRVVLAEGLAEVSYWVLPGTRGRRIAGRALAAATATKRGEGHHADGWHDMHMHARLETDT